MYKSSTTRRTLVGQYPIVIAFEKNSFIRPVFQHSPFHNNNLQNPEDRFDCFYIKRDIIIVGKISFLLGLLFYTGQKAGDSRRSPAFCLPII